MDREAAVIRSEMSQTRADLDRKITQLEERARELTPRRYMQRHLPDHMPQRAIGAVLTMLGIAMAWRMHRARSARRSQVREAMVSYGRW